MTALGAVSTLSWCPLFLHWFSTVSKSDLRITFLCYWKPFSGPNWCDPPSDQTQPSLSSWPWSHSAVRSPSLNHASLILGLAPAHNYFFFFFRIKFRWSYLREGTCHVRPLRPWSCISLKHSIRVYQAGSFFNGDCNPAVSFLAKSSWYRPPLLLVLDRYVQCPSSHSKCAWCMYRNIIIGK